MSSTMILLCLWSASAALGAFLFIVVKPKLRAFEESGSKERDRIWECMDRLAARRTSMKLLGALVSQEQHAFAELQGATTLEALERPSRDFQNAGFLLVALDVDAGMLEAELELVAARHGRFFYHCFLRSTAITALHMIESARAEKLKLLSPMPVVASAKVRS